MLNQLITHRFAVRRLIDKASASHLDSLETRLVARIDDIERFYPWPALVQSFKADIEQIRARRHQLK